MVIRVNYEGKSLPVNKRTAFQNEYLRQVPVRRYSADGGVDEKDYDVVEKLSSGSSGIFLEGISDYLGISTDMPVEILTEIKRRYRERGVPLNDRTLEKWVYDNKIPNPGRRTKAVRLDFCFAMGFSVEKTKEFMIKNFQSTPFYLRNRTDAVYYYCILNGRDYASVTELLEKAEALGPSGGGCSGTVNTEPDINRIKNDTEFLNWLADCCEPEYEISEDDAEEGAPVKKTPKKDEFSTARAEASKLLEEAYRLAETTSGAALMEKICGYGKKYSGLSKTKLPDDFRRSFPDEQTLSNLNKGKHITDLQLRKLIVLLKFYIFFTRCVRFRETENITAEQIESDSNDFRVQLDSIMLRCGLMPVYLRNEFDSTVMWCTRSPDPVMKLHAAISDKLCDAE